MIKKSILAVCSLALALTTSAQNAYDAERVIGNELNGQPVLWVWVVL